MANRQEGYYHVKYNGEWLVGYQRKDCYWDLLPKEGFVGNSEDYEDDELEEINETRILSPDEESIRMSDVLKESLTKTWEEYVADEANDRLLRVENGGDKSIDSPSGTEIKLGNEIVIGGYKSTIVKVNEDRSFYVVRH